MFSTIEHVIELVLFHFFFLFMSSKRNTKHGYVKESQIIYISGIPKEYNTIPQLYKHFSQFGHIQSVWCSNEHASIIFESVEAARSAVQSPIAYAKNRFIEITFHQNPFRAYSDLRNVIDYQKVRKINSEVCTKIDNELTNSLIKRYRIYKEQKGNIDGEIAKLQNARDALVQEGTQCMIKIESSVGDENIKLKRRLMEIAKLLKENEKRLDELTEFRSNEMNGNKEENKTTEADT